MVKLDPTSTDFTPLHVNIPSYGCQKPRLEGDGKGETEREQHVLQYMQGCCRAHFSTLEHMKHDRIRKVYMDIIWFEITCFDDYRY